MIYTTKLWTPVTFLACQQAPVVVRLTIIATTQPTTQNKTKQLGCCGIIIDKEPTTPHWVPLQLRQFYTT